MADEIQIKPVGGDPQDTQGQVAGNTAASQGQTGSSQAAQSQSGTGNSTQPATTDPSSSVQPTVTQPATAQPPTIEPTQVVVTQPATPQSAVTPQTAPVPKKGFNLADELEEENTNQAPPEKYAIPSVVKEKFPDLVDLIKATESMSDDEREYWFQILPIMTEEQIIKFRDILVNEKEQLAKLDNEYEDELNRLNEKHMIEWKEFESKEKRRALTEAEQQASTNEQQTEEDLLAKLNQI